MTTGRCNTSAQITRWQLRAVDVDGTGQTNLFKYIAGLDPLDATSRFVLKAAEVPSQPGQKNLVFSPVVAGRTYTVVAKTDLLSPTWTPINGSVPIDAGSQRTITILPRVGRASSIRCRLPSPERACVQKGIVLPVHDTPRCSV